MKQRKYLMFLLLAITQEGYSQNSTDTAALVKEFSKIMAFTTQPYLYYTTVTKIDAQPVLKDKDTVSTNGVFYKNNSQIYCNTDKDEMYVEDSLVVQINNDNKTIWISKANTSSNEKMNVVPAATRKMLEVLQRNFTISKVKMLDGLARLSFETRKQPYSNSTTSSLIVLEYWEETQLPRSLSIEMSMKQPATDEMIAAIKNEGIDETKLVQKIEGINYIVSMQRVSILFTNIENTIEKVNQIATYKEKIRYDEMARKFTGKGVYDEYEITKTF